MDMKQVLMQKWSEGPVYDQELGVCELPFGDLSAAGLILDLAYQNISKEEWAELFEIAIEVDMTEHVDDMFSGKVINTSEQRSVLHTALRNTSKKPIFYDGKNVMPQIEEVWRRIQSLCDQWVGVTDLIHIGIGGSVFGTQLVVEALANLPVSNSRGMRIHFAANIDSEELVQIFNQAIPESTKVIIVSKSFHTNETLMNAKAVMNWLKSRGRSDDQIGDALLAVTANSSGAASIGVSTNNIFPFWDWVGGRFSVWSAVGLCIALQYGFDTFMSFLKGAESIDEHFHNAPIEKNLPILMALALLHQQVEHSSNAYAVIPYVNSLGTFPFWLQQLEMESHGKSVGRDGQLIYRASPVVFGSVGSNAQHSYFQLLHQGSQIIPVDFIVVAEAMSDIPEAVDHHRVLLANCLAQAQGLSLGKASKFTNEVHTGKRPSNLIVIPQLNAFSLGALLALYESRAVALGILWGINSFDQPGVELGKQLARPITSALMNGSQIDAELIDSVTSERVDYFNSYAALSAK